MYKKYINREINIYREKLVYLCVLYVDIDRELGGWRV